MSGFSRILFSSRLRFSTHAFPLSIRKFTLLYLLIMLSAIRGIHEFVAAGALEAAFMEFLAQSDSLLGKIHSLSASRAHGASA